MSDSLDLLLLFLPRGASIFRRETVNAFRVSFPVAVPNHTNQFREYEHVDLAEALRLAYLDFFKDEAYRPEWLTNV